MIKIMKFLFLMTILFLVSCESKLRIHEKTFKITYLDGKTEVLTIQDKINSCCRFPKVTVFFHDNCLYRTHYETKYDSPYQDCFRCGVVKYSIINEYQNF